MRHLLRLIPSCFTFCRQTWTQKAVTYNHTTNLIICSLAPRPIHSSSQVIMISIIVISGCGSQRSKLKLVNFYVCKSLITLRVQKLFHLRIHDTPTIIIYIPSSGDSSKCIIWHLICIPDALVYSKMGFAGWNYRQFLICNKVIVPCSLDDLLRTVHHRVILHISLRCRIRSRHVDQIMILILVCVDWILVEMMVMILRMIWLMNASCFHCVNLAWNEVILAIGWQSFRAMICWRASLCGSIFLLLHSHVLVGTVRTHGNSLSNICSEIFLILIHGRRE